VRDAAQLNVVIRSERYVYVDVETARKLPDTVNFINPGKASIDPLQFARAHEDNAASSITKSRHESRKLELVSEASLQHDGECFPAEVFSLPPCGTGAVMRRQIAVLHQRPRCCVSAIGEVQAAEQHFDAIKIGIDLECLSIVRAGLIKQAGVLAVLPALHSGHGLRIRRSTRRARWARRDCWALRRNRHTQ